jgi:YD repeat-containing protein
MRIIFVLTIFFGVIISDIYSQARYGFLQAANEPTIEGLNKDNPRNLYNRELAPIRHYQNYISPKILNEKNRDSVPVYLNRPISAMINNGTERHSYTYDSQGNLLSHLSQWKKNNLWENLKREMFTYNSKGLPLIVISEAWYGSSWSNIYSYHNTYDSASRLSTQIYGFQGENYRRYKYTYNQNGVKLECDLNAWSDGDWDKYLRFKYYYDLNGNLIEEMMEMRGLSYWRQDIKTTYTYDNNGNNLSFLAEWLIDN